MNQLQKLAQGGDKFITQSKPTYFHQFFTKKILTEGESIDNYMEVTSSEKQAIENKDATFVEPSKLFIDMWNKACGVQGCYNESTGLFELNGLTDITYEQALKIFEHPLRTSYDCRGYLWNAGIKTNLMLSNVGTGPVNCQNMFNNSGIVIACLPNNIIAGMIDGMFVNCGSLKEVIGIISMQSSTGQFNEANNTPCEKLFLHRINRSLKMQFFYKLNLESWQYMVSHAINTSAITITVHPNVYAKLTDESNTEWHQLLLDATEKQIQFVTNDN